MKFFTLLAALPFVAFASPVAEPEADIAERGAFFFPNPFNPNNLPDKSNDVSADLDAVIKSSKDLSAVLDKIDPQAPSVDFPTLVSLLVGSDTINKAVNKTIDDCNASSNFGQAVPIGIKNLQLADVVEALLNNFQKHVKAFKNQGVAFVVADQLKLQKTGSNNFAAAIGPKLGLLNAFTPVISQRLNKKFDETIAIYN